MWLCVGVWGGGGLYTPEVTIFVYSQFNFKSTWILVSKDFVYIYGWDCSLKFCFYFFPESGL